MTSVCMYVFSQAFIPVPGYPGSVTVCSAYSTDFLVTLQVIIGIG